MKHFIIPILLLLPIYFLAQSSELRDLEAAANNLRGSQLVENQLQLAQLYLDQNRYENCIRAAEAAYKEARNVNDTSSMALALHLGAQAMLLVRKPRLMQQNRALRKLQESIRLLEGTGNDSLLIENLLILRRLAKSKGKTKEVQELEARIKRLESSQELAAVLGEVPSEDGRKNLREKAKDAILGFKATNEDLNSRLEELNMENEELGKELEAREEQISQLSEEQMKVELMLMKQRNLVDSLHINRLRDSMLLSKQEMDIQMAETKLQINKGQRNLLLALATIVVILGISFYARYRGIKRYSAIIENEKKRSDDLLLNILPGPIAEELKQEGVAQARQHKEVTVLFSDFKNFSRIAATLSPEKLVADLDYCFKEFDKIIEKYQLEKIKTIGDAYMCAGGLPVPDPEHPKRVVQAALEMQVFLENWKMEKRSAGEPIFEARLGIHTGPIIAGVVGVKKFAYDIWGDTVNVASRMESSGEAGRVNISATTYAMIKNEFSCIPRGKVPTKNFGEIDMYFVDERTTVALGKAERLS